MGTYLVLEKKSQPVKGELAPLQLSFYSSTGKKLASLITNSGQAFNQTFLTAGGGIPKNYGPVEEGYYDLGPLEWAGNKFDFDSSWGYGLGPIWVSVIPAAGNVTRRSAIGIHLDANRRENPGTAGCIGLRSVEDVKTFVGWFSHNQGPPTRLIVDWGLNTVKTSTIPPEHQKFKLYSNGPKVTAFKNGAPAKWTLVKLFLSGEKLACNLNYDEVELISSEVILTYKDKINEKKD